MHNRIICIHVLWGVLRPHSKCINSLAPGRPGYHFKTATFNLVLLIGIFTLSNNNALGWMPWDLTDDKSPLVQVMAWCHQATSHYLNQCFPRSLSPYGVTRPQWVKAHPSHANPLICSWPQSCWWRFIECCRNCSKLMHHLICQTLFIALRHFPDNIFRCFFLTDYV